MLSNNPQLSKVGCDIVQLRDDYWASWRPLVNGCVDLCGFMVRLPARPPVGLRVISVGAADFSKIGRWWGGAPCGFMALCGFMCTCEDADGAIHNWNVIVAAFLLQERNFFS